MTFTFEIMCHLLRMKDEKFLLKWSKFKLPLHSPKPEFLQHWRKQGDVFMKLRKLRLHKAPRLFFFFFWHIHSLSFSWVTLPPHPVLSQLCWKLQRGQKGNKDPGKIPRILQSPCYFTHLKIVPHTGIAKETLLGLPSNGMHDLEFSKGSPIFHYLKSSSFSFASLSSSLWPESILIYK